MSEERSIEMEIEVPGDLEDVWRAIATGPGISSWYVPHVVEERQGGAATASFGPGPEMQVSGRVAVWDPPHRVVFDGGEGAPGLVFSWSVEPLEGDECLVRLVNSGFGIGEEWNEQYEAMTGGWEMFLLNLTLHLQHFRGQEARAVLASDRWSGPREVAWAALTGALGIPATPGMGQRIEVGVPEAPALAGAVVDAASWRMALVLDAPEPGTALIAAEGATVSVWSYLYGPGAAASAERDEPRWAAWLAAHRPAES